MTKSPKSTKTAPITIPTLPSAANPTGFDLRNVPLSVSF
ncbi:MAG: hypothetical protein JWL83_26 [Actinomycetia bacterium]|nr:hypothetical protein [Actinomycetes bacterium]